MKTLRMTLCNPAITGAGSIGLFYILRATFGFPSTVLGGLLFLAAFGYGSLLVFLIPFVASNWFRWQIKANDADDTLFWRLLTLPAQALATILIAALAARLSGDVVTSVRLGATVITFQVALATLALGRWRGPESSCRSS